MQKLTREEFNSLIREMGSKGGETLITKNAKYAPGDDPLHNFRDGAEIFGGTMADACWGYMTKHLVALRDKVKRNDFHDLADVFEKCQDIKNYIDFIWCIANEEYKNYVEGETSSCMNVLIYEKGCPNILKTYPASSHPKVMNYDDEFVIEYNEIYSGTVIKEVWTKDLYECEIC